MNKYRVDRVNSKIVPCGMNSILYIGDSFKQALAVYNRSDIGLDWWNKPNITYGVILSIWDDANREYVIKCSKGL